MMGGGLPSHCVSGSLGNADVKKNKPDRRLAKLSFYDAKNVQS
jgi:hypothetical protein